MNRLSESVFEGISVENVARVNADFVPNDKDVSKVIGNGEPLQLSSLLKLHTLLTMLSSNQDSECGINFRSFTIGEKSVGHATIRILQYGGVNNVSAFFCCRGLSLTETKE
jgi:hypothetical protein